MKAVNLVPRDARRSGVAPSLGKLGAPHAVIGLLVVALAFVTVYVLTSNTVSSRKAQLAGVEQQITRMQAAVTRLQSYQSFEKLAQTRAATVREIASTRFDWHGALADLSKVVPSNTSLQSLVATVSPNTSGAGASGGAGGAVRGDINAPAFELKGCTGSQDEVAQVMSRLRLINGVSRVTLEDSTQTGSGSTSATSGACSGPTFDMVVFFQPGSTAATSTSQTASLTGSAK
jgi:Tfp pilus assembly protein PilN